jgi:hypothetical protein
MKFPLSISNILSIGLNAIVLALMIKLRDEYCTCISDWRNVYIIVYSSFMIAVGLISPILLMMGYSKYEYLAKKYKKTAILFSISIIALMILNVYSLYTYTADLETTQCNCAMGRDNLLFGFIYYYIRVAVILLLVVIIFTALDALFY